MRKGLRNERLVYSIVQEEGISGFMNRRHLKEEAGQRRPGLALSHVDVQGRDKGESMLTNAEALTGVISDTNNRASNAFAVMIESEATDGAGGASAGLGPFPIANHQDEMKSVVSKPDSNAQVSPFSSSHTPTSTSTTTSSAIAMGPLEHGDSPPQNPAVRLFVTNPSDDSLIDDCTYEDQRGHSSIPGPIGASSVPPCVQSEYYKEGESVAVGDANAGGQEAETNVMWTPAPCIPSMALAV
ncbi:hypothetical protein BKA70DRAFT_273513 [Coprinopsis sp. MPI-PUGE-AT-0042]|nr:hypothetical protein BKA70DRAFT_273513 [Coprinopsis sp. MPI-PUGE-AT-0042]